MSRPRRTRIKICGITTLEAARAAVDAGADAIGFVFNSASPRFIDHGPAEAIACAVPPSVMTVRVYRDDSEEAVIPWEGQALQFHGYEDEEYLRRVGELVHEPFLIRGFKFSPDAVRRWDRCEAVAALLIDGPEAGSGRAFDHTELAAMMPEIAKPVFLAGGLTSVNVGAAIATVRPYAVDVSSGVESSPGVKDPDLIRAFCDAVRAADAAGADS